MVKIFLVILMINSYLWSFSFFDSERYINGEYNKNLKVLWMQSNLSPKLKSKFIKAQNNIYKKLYKNNDFQNIENLKIRYNNSLLSVISNPMIYSDKKKMIEADIRYFFDKELENQLVVLFILEKLVGDNYRLWGLKMFKDGDKMIATTHEVNKEEKDISQKSLESMLEFFILSSIDDYKSVERIKYQKIATFDEKNGNLNVEILRENFLKKFITDVEKNDFQLAKRLGFIKSKKFTQETAQNYCEIMGMNLEKQLFIAKEDLDDYFYTGAFHIEVETTDNIKIVTKIISNQNRMNKKFRCIDKNRIDIVVKKEYTIKSKIWKDRETSLIWQVNIDKRSNWNNAKRYCKNLVLDERDDWRLPTRKELNSIKTKNNYPNSQSYSKKTYIKKPLLNSMSMSNQWFWSSMESKKNSSRAWGIDFSNGGDYFYGKLYEGYVRCVVGRQ